MKNIESILSVRSINRCSLNNEKGLSYLVEASNKKKIDQSIFKGLGKGKWLFFLADLEDKNIKIISFSPETLCLKILERFFESNQKVSLDLNLNFQYWDQNPEQRRIFLEKATKNAAFKIEIYPENEEVSSLEVKISGEDKFDKILKSFKNLLSHFQSANPKMLSFPYITINLNDLEIILDSDSLELGGNFDKNKIENLLCSIFSFKNKIPQKYYLIYPEINKIEGEDWEKAVKHGNLIKEHGTIDKSTIEKLVF